MKISLNSSNKNWSKNFKKFILLHWRTQNYKYHNLPITNMIIFIQQNSQVTVDRY